jgi:hypothetical protein
LRIPNQPDGGTGGQFSELMRLQAEFQSGLAEETILYLRRLQGASAPASPGTVVVPERSRELVTSGQPGTAAEVGVEIENRQRVHCVVSPSLSPQVGSSGVTWFPEAELIPTMLLAPEEIATLQIKLSIPSEIPAGTYRGALMLRGFSDGAIALTVNVLNGARTHRGSAAANAKTRSRSTRKTAEKKSAAVARSGRRRKS